MALGPLKTKKIASEAPSPHLTASKPRGAKTMCRQKLRNEVPAARNLALCCHPRLISPCFLLPHIKTCERMRRGAVTRDFDHGDLICLLRRTNRLPGCGTWADKSTTTWTPGEGLRRLSEQPAPIAKLPSCSRPSKVTRVRADLDCLLRHVSRANLGRDGGVACLKRQSSGSLSSSRSSARRAEQRRFARGTDAGTQQRTGRISRLAAVRDVQSESSRSANQSSPGPIR
jgi:hypothetical protein